MIIIIIIIIIIKRAMSNVNLNLYNNVIHHDNILSGLGYETQHPNTFCNEKKSLFDNIVQITS